MSPTPFEYRRADETTTDGRATALAGGTDLLPLHSLGLVRPETVVDLKTGALPSTIERDGADWSVGALATLADLEDDDALATAFRAIADAVGQAATRQIRNRATVGGNLLQRPRCRYYRDEDTSCWFTGGDGCPARQGLNEHHAVFGSSPCVAVQPSDLASVLVALDARVALEGGDRPDLAVEDLLVAPTDEHRELHGLRPGELIRSVRIRRPDGLRSAYRKAMDRSAWQFALAGVAVAITEDDDATVTEARVVAAGVANTPWRLAGSEAALVGAPLTAETVAAAANRATDGAEPLERNGYKLPLLRGLVRRALEDLHPGG